MKTKLFGTLLIVIFGLTCCKDELDNTTYFTANILSVTQRLELGPDTFSSYVELLRLTGYYSALQSYGSYTCFVPTNEAISTYINNRWGVSSVSQLSSSQIDEMKYVLQFHIMRTRKLASSFSEGRLSDTTYTGDFLTTSFTAGGGIKNVLVNKQSKIILPDITADNGVIHVINRVLDPFIDPLPVVIEKSGKFSIFIEAFKQTGYFDDYSEIFSPDHKRLFFTIMAESDSVYNIAGINSFTDLADSISPGKTDYLNKSNLLNQYMAYHVIASFFYTADFPGDGFMTSQLENAAIKCKKAGNIIKLNETETGLNDTWINPIIPKSNNPARNGVFHSLDNIMQVFTPKAKWIMFDVVSDQPEFKAGQIKTNTQNPSTAWSEIEWYPEANQRFLTYGSGDATRVCYNRNLFDFSGRVWYEFITPIIPKGKYEFLVCALSGSARGMFQVYWDGEPVGSVYPLNYSDATTAFGWPDSATMETYRWRHGKTWIESGGITQYNFASQCRFVISRELLCPVQKRHVIRLLAIRAGGLPLDYFEFIPVN